MYNSLKINSLQITTCWLPYENVTMGVRFCRDLSKMTIPDWVFYEPVVRSNVCFKRIEVAGKPLIIPHKPHRFWRVGIMLPV